MAKKTQYKKRKQPVRTCVSCGEKNVKRNVVRIVRTKEGEVFVDSTGKVRGRGANFCEDIDCFEKAVRKGLIERSLALEEKLPDAVINDMRKDFKEVLYEREFRKGKKPVTLRIKKKDLIEVL